MKKEQGENFLSHFNTSNVTILQSRRQPMHWPQGNFNTSNVTILPKRAIFDLLEGLISIHQMLLFYKIGRWDGCVSMNFNTSNVTILPCGTTGTAVSNVDFNTSNVTILPQKALYYFLRTRFQYIKCYYSTRFP